jgi:flagellar motor switch/type III secretory pathway protein FliN
MIEPAISAEPESGLAEVIDVWTPVHSLPCVLTLDLPMRGFNLDALLRLEPKAVIDSHWPITDDVPLRVNGELIAWGEFEVVRGRLAIRLIELT